MNNRGGKRIEIDRHNYNSSPHWSPSGRKIVYGHSLPDRHAPNNDSEIRTANADEKRADGSYR